jgi:hypothetical protein
MAQVTLRRAAKSMSVNTLRSSLWMRIDGNEAADEKRRIL